LSFIGIELFRLTNELNSTEGELWKEKLPSDQNDIERFVNYLKLKTNYSEVNCCEWYLNHAERFYLDGCFVLAIRFYTVCIELQPDMKDAYLKRAACYLKVYEVKFEYLIFRKEGNECCCSHTR
jgi:hypothetical protein